MTEAAQASEIGALYGPILVVNDDDATRYMLTRILRRAGYQILEAVNGLEALELANHRPALVILDIKLPDVSGLEVCRRLKANPETAKIPVLQTSATFVSAERRVEGLDSGADGYLAQPIEPPELTATVRALLRTSRAEQSVREAADDWQRTFDAIGEPVALFDQNGALIRGNEAFSRLVDGLAPAIASYDDFSRQLFHGAAPRLNPQARETAEASYADRCYRLTVDPIDGEKAEPTRYVVVCTDLTETKRLEEVQRNRAEELVEGNRRKDEFLAMLAHELRNPLNAIAAAVALHDRISGKDERTSRLRAAITRQTKNLARLVDDLLDVSRLTRGQIPLKRERVDLAGVVGSVAASCQPLLESRQQTLALTVIQGTIPVEADVLRLEQAIMNLISNASKFSDLGGRIELGVAAQGSGPSATITVRDYGVGIPKEKLDSVFDMFFQVDPTLARSRGGLGIGLTVTRQLVELHGGTIKAGSAGVGRGAEFVISLPLAAALPELAPAPSANGGAAPALSGHAGDTREVLVIEDDHDTADILRDLLTDMGHHVAASYDGNSGLRAALSGCYDVAFVDIGLPGIDGYEVARTLRASPKFQRLLLVAVTGYGQPQDRARAMEAGFDLHIVKPLQPEQLATVFARHEFRRSA